MRGNIKGSLGISGVVEVVRKKRVGGIGEREVACGRIRQDVRRRMEEGRRRRWNGWGRKMRRSGEHVRKLS